MTRRIADLDVPLPRLKQQMRDLVARQEAQRADADWPATRRAIAARQDQIRQYTNPTTPEEAP
ncbi:hypothetical protein [Streptomyces sp. NBC_01530]|uniref:hypothetical protein n=1 Tax=Streptomyces sp. NBC_01530 TaxID=2903895 RepID=UPI0038631BC9